MPEEKEGRRDRRKGDRRQRRDGERRPRRDDRRNERAEAPKAVNPRVRKTPKVDPAEEAAKKAAEAQVEESQVSENTETATEE